MVFDRGGRAFASEDTYDLRPPTSGNQIGKSHRKAKVPTGPHLTTKTPTYRHVTEDVRINALDEH